jgi:hypothetical protein
MRELISPVKLQGSGRIFYPAFQRVRITNGTLVGEEDDLFSAIELGFGRSYSS